MKSKQIKTYIGKLAILAAIAVGAVVMRQTGVGCVFRRVFGVTCPGCGMGHAIDALFRLDLAEAWRWHPMVFSLPLLAVYLLKDGPLLRSKKADAVMLILIGVGFLINYVVNWNNPILFD